MHEMKTLWIPASDLTLGDKVVHIDKVLTVTQIHPNPKGTILFLDHKDKPFTEYVVDNDTLVCTMPPAPKVQHSEWEVKKLDRKFTVTRVTSIVDGGGGIMISSRGLGAEAEMRELADELNS